MSDAQGLSALIEGTSNSGYQVRVLTEDGEVIEQTDYTPEAENEAWDKYDEYVATYVVDSPEIASVQLADPAGDALAEATNA